jgi:2-(1,2-epoxy-1,2-dihydrophenyl)acetyl-CoA isomerase
VPAPPPADDVAGAVVWPTGTDVVDVSLRGRVAVITFNRPERRNAIHREMHAPITRALREFAGRDDVGVVVFTGAGSAFCAGGDVKGDPDAPVPRDPGEREAALLADAQVVREIWEHPKLTVAALNGAAVGAGLSIALACDLRIAAASARLVTGWARLAFSGDYGGAWFLTRLVGPSRALELLAGNAALDGDAALAHGLVNRVVPDAEFPAAWAAWAAELAAGSTTAQMGMKANVRDALNLPLGESLPLETHRMVESAGTVDHREAVRAMRERRPPRFPGADGDR